MEVGESRRARKPVNYAEVADVILDDDFVDFKTTFKSKTEKDNDRKEKLNGEEQKDEREVKHSKDRHRDRKKHKDKDRHREDKDKHRRDRDRHREGRDTHRKRDSKERDERKRRERKEREHRSERSDDKPSQDSGKGEGSSDSTCGSSGTATLLDSPATTLPVNASSLVSPRRNPKPRLTVEEKIFQRELQAALELSKEKSIQDSPNTPESNEQKVTEQEGGTVDEGHETPPLPSPQFESLLEDSGEDGCFIPTQKLESIVEASPSAPEKPSALKCVEEMLQIFDATPPPPPPAVPDNNNTMEPEPSTSYGKTAKRIRKTVKFKEDSDSDGFDGFGYNVGAESEASEGSDFLPSPKKKKKVKESKKAKNTKANKTTNTRKSSCKSTDQNKTGDLASPPRSRQVKAKENTAPKNSATPPPPPVQNTVPSPKVTTSPELKPSLNLHTTPPPPPKPSTKKTSVAKPVKRPLINVPSSPSSGTSSIALVKTQFRSPLSTSLNSGHPLVSSSSSMGTKALYRGTGLRLGLSRRANVKSLHPSASGSI